MLEDYNIFKKHGRYPFGDGSKYTQPIWAIKNFRTLDLLNEYFELDKVHGIKRVDDSVPRAEQLFKDPARAIKVSDG